MPRCYKKIDLLTLNVHWTLKGSEDWRAVSRVEEDIYENTSKVCKSVAFEDRTSKKNKGSDRKLPSHVLDVQLPVKFEHIAAVSRLHIKIVLNEQGEQNKIIVKEKGEGGVSRQPSMFIGR